MSKIWCLGCGQEIQIPAGIESGDMFDCSNCAGLTLRAIETNRVWTVREVKKASCPIGNELVFLPDDVAPGDLIECHGVRHRVTYEFGGYALVRADA